jgi:malonate-semialdehyde dehydrogenase (acetylating)/methylmalonate-semialdehyde dehydrogenase
MPDADIEFAASHLSAAAYGSAGQRCMAISVAVAVGDIGDELVAKLARQAREVRVGAGLDPNSEMGPLITAEARARVEAYVAAGVDSGATAVVDGRGLEMEGDGFWIGPTLFDHVTTDLAIYTDEIFGPVLCVVRVSTPEEAVDLINRNPYANGCAVFTSSGGTARWFQRAADVGMVGINVPIPVPMAFHSFGGRRDSLFGDHHAHGPEGVRFYTRNKAITSRWPPPGASGDDHRAPLSFPTST